MSKENERTLCISTTPFGVFLLIAQIVPAILIIPVLYFGMKESIKLTPKLLKYKYWMSSFALFVSAIMMPINQMFDFPFSGYCDNFSRISITNTIMVIAYLLSLISISTFYSIRFILSFKNSPYAASNCIYSFLIFSTLIQYILVAITEYFNYMAWYSLNHDLEDDLLIYSHLTFLFLTIFAVINILNNIILLICFLSKLHQISKDINLNDIQSNSIIEHAVTYTVCLCIVFITTMAQFGVGWMRGSLFVDTNELFMIHNALASWDIFCNSLAINLQFNAAKNVFNKFCKCCKNNLMICLFESLMNDNYDEKDYDKQSKITTIISSASTNATTNESNLEALQLMIKQKVETTNTNNKTNTNNNIALIAQANNKWVEDDQVIFNKVTMDSSTKKSKKDTSSAAKSVTGTTTTTTSDIDFSSRLYT
eukprot:482811_1